MDFVEWIKQSWMYILTFSTALTAGITLYKNIVLVHRHLKAPDEIQDAAIQSAQDKLDRLEAKQASCEERWEDVIVVKKQFDDNFIHLNNAMVALMRDRISRYFFKCNKKGYITPVELEIVTELFHAYTAMGGNGVIAREMEVLNKFPIFNSEDEYQTWIAQKRTVKKG